MTEVTRFQLGFQVPEDELSPGDLFRMADGTVWKVNPDASFSQLGGGGGSLPAWWTVDSDTDIVTMAPAVPGGFDDGGVPFGQENMVSTWTPSPEIYGGDVFGISYSTSPDNADSLGGGLPDVLGLADRYVITFSTAEDPLNPGSDASKETWSLQTRRRADGEVSAYIALTPTNFYARRYNPDTQTITDEISFSVPHGISMDGSGMQEYISIWADFDQTVQLLSFVPNSGSAKWGIFSAAANPAGQQAHIAAPSGGGTVDTQARAAIAALLTELQAYGWLAAS